MFLIVGTLVGLNLMIRVVLSEARELQAYRGEPRVRMGDIPKITLRGVPFLLVFIAIGVGLDLVFDSSIIDLSE